MTDKDDDNPNQTSVDENSGRTSPESGKSSKPAARASAKPSAKQRRRSEQKEANRSILTLEAKARRSGRTRLGYLLHSAKNNLNHFVHSAPFNFIIALLIIFSVVLIFAEFLIPSSSDVEKIAEINDVITWIFIVELSVRFIAARNKAIFFRNYWIDILAVLPVLRVFRTFRLLRLLRLLRLSRAFLILLRESGWLSARFERFFGSFGVVLITALVLVVCGTLALLTVDQANLAQNQAFDVFLQRIWQTTFLFISGEIVGELPPTAGGKFIAVLICIAGMMVFAVLVGATSAAMGAYFRTKMERKDLKLEDLTDHTIICGWDRMGSLILSELETVTELWNRGLVIVAETEIDFSKDCLVKNPRRLFHVREDFTKMDILEQVGAKRARSAIVLADKGINLGDQDRDARTVLAALTLEKLNPKIFTCAELLDQKNATHLQMAGVEEIISRTNLTAGLFASTIVNGGISTVISDILTHKEGAYLRKVPLPKQFVGQEFILVMEYFKRSLDAIVIAVDSVGSQGKPVRQVNPSHDREMNSGDQLIVMTRVDSALRGFSS